MSPTIPKKRNRLSLSCNYCKKRKVKCDRDRPCSSCVKYNVGHLCSYPDEDFPGVYTREKGADSNSPAEHSGLMSTFAIKSNVLSNGTPQSKPEDNQSKFYPEGSAADGYTHYYDQRRVPGLPPLQNPPLQNPPTNPMNPINQNPYQNSHVHNPQMTPTNPGIPINHYMGPHHNISPPVQAPLHVPHMPGHVHPSHNYRTPLTSSDSASEVQSQLDMLKSKIKEIESSFGNSANSVNSSTTSSVHSEAPLPHPQTYNSPLKPEIDWQSLRYNPDKNPTYIGINPYASEEETINFYDSYTPIHIKDSSRRINYGPFAWLSLMKLDPATPKLWKFMLSSRFDYSRYLQQPLAAASGGVKDLPPYSSLVHFKPLVTPSGVQPVLIKTQDAESAFRAKAIDRDGYNDLRLYGNMKVSEMRSLMECKKDKEHSEVDAEAEKKKNGFVKGKIQRKLMNKHAISLGLTFYEGELDQELHLIEKIKMVLPKQKVIWKLIDVFFLYMYPFMPFLDEEYFKADMAKILGPEGHADAKIEKLSIEKRLDLANIGVLFVVIRFAYLSLFSNRNGVNENNLKSEDPSPEAQELKYLLSNPINIDLIDLAQLCLDQFDLMRKSNLAVLQCAFFMRLYQMFAPEDGDGADGGYSQIFNGVLVQMAYSMGINREPDNFSDICNDGRLNNVARKIWFFLMVADLNLAFKFGNPMNINGKYYDVKQPYYKSGNENIKDVEMEKWVISTFAYFDNYYNRLLNILDTCLDIKKHTKMPKLIGLVTDFEQALNTNYGSLKQYLVPFKKETFHYPFIKIMKCKTYINMKGFLMTLNTHFYLYYERKKNVDFAYFYLKKNFAIMCGEFIPGYFELIVNNYINFGYGADLIMNPTVEFSIHKVSHFIFAVLLRLNLSIYRMKHDENHASKLRGNFNYKVRFSKICKLSTILEKIVQYCIAAMSRLSQRYYYAWRVTKAQNFLMKIVSGEEFFKFCEDKEEVKFIDLNLEQIEELTNISETALKKFGKTKIFPASSVLLDTINGEDLEFSHPSNRNASVPEQKERVPVTEAPAANKTASVNLGPESAGSEYDEFQFIENAETDLLWFQMANMKSDLDGANSTDAGANGSEFSQTPRPRTSSINPTNGFDLPSMTPLANPLSPETIGDDLAGNINASHFSSFLDGYEIFNGMPIDKFLGVQRDQPDIL